MANIAFITWIAITFMASTVGANAKTEAINSKIVNTHAVELKEVNQLIAESKIRSLNISQEELNRAKVYQALADEMDSNNTLSTLELLGVYAETEAEKQKYARKFVKAFRVHTQKVLDFQKIVRQTYQDIYGLDSMFDYNASQRNVTQVITRVSKVIDLNSCDEACEQSATLAILLSNQQGVDFYFKNASALEIQNWALKMGIAVETVDSGLITLNHYSK